MRLRLPLPRTIAARLILVVSLSAAIIFAALLGFNYSRSRALLEREVASSAHHLALASVSRVEAALGKVARAGTTLARHLENSAVGERELRVLLLNVLDNNPEVHGVGVAFEPDAQGAKSRPNAPYLYREGVNIKSSAPEENFAYLHQDRYQIARELDSAGWSEPYYDDGGGNTLMATYSVPFYQSEGGQRRIKGIVSTDIALDWLTQDIGSIKVLDSGYAFLLSRNGAIVSHPVAEDIMNESIFSLAEARADPALREVGRRMLRGESDFIAYTTKAGAASRLYYAPVPAVGWTLAIVFPEAELFADIRQLTWNAAAIGALGILLMALVVVLTARSITRPLSALVAVAGQMSDGNFDVSLPAQTARDEVGELSRAFAAMSRALREHIRQLVDTTAAKERIEGELSVAHDIQMSILPKMLPPFPHHESFNLFAAIAPAKEVGGDFYDFFQIDDAHLGLVIADASGKGVPASLFMAVAKTLIKATARVDRSPAEILGEVNDELSRNNDQSMFITVFFAILDLRSGELCYANAGHNPPLLISRDGAVSYLPRTRQLVLGAMEDYRYRCDTLSLAPGDRLFLYTDGVTEAMDEVGEQYSEQGLLATLTGQPPCAIDALTGATVAAVKQFAGAAPQSDDITIMVVEYLGGPQPAPVQVADGDHHPS